MQNPCLIKTRMSNRHAEWHRSWHMLRITAHKGKRHQEEGYGLREAETGRQDRERQTDRHIKTSTIISAFSICNVKYYKLHGFLYQFWFR